MIKMIYESQTPIDRQERTYDKNFFNFDYDELVMHTADVKKGSFNLVVNSAKSAE